MEEVESGHLAVAALPAREEERHGTMNPSPTMIVTFPDAARRRAQSFPPPLRLEGEESTEDMNHHNMWQVFLPSRSLRLPFQMVEAMQTDGVQTLTRGSDLKEGDSQKLILCNL